MSRALTPAITLDSLKKEAKRWLKALRAQDQPARARLQRAFPNAPAEPGLRDVQHALALEHGLAGWTALKKALDEAATARRRHADLDAWFLENACPDHHVRGGPAHVMALHTAERILTRNPDIARHSLYTAIVCGDLEEVDACADGAAAGRDGEGRPERMGAAPVSLLRTAADRQRRATTPSRSLARCSTAARIRTRTSWPATAATRHWSA